MASLYELDSEFLACVQLDKDHVVNEETGEILDLEQFEALKMERAAKIENCMCYIKNKRAFANSIAAEVCKLNERKEAALREAERCEEYLAGRLCGEKFKSPRGEIRWRKSQVCNVISMEEIPEKYKVTKITIMADRTAIKNAIKSGISVPGAEIHENNNMIIK